MSHHIAFRRGGALVDGERPVVGEPIWDPSKSRLGMFNNINDAVEWFMRVYGNVVQLNANQFLTGEAANGANNNIYFDFSVANEVTIRNNVTSAVLARFNDSGSFLLNPTMAATAEVGISNRVINGNLAIKFVGAAPQLPSSTVGMIESRVIAPNWLLWKATGSVGDMSVNFDELDKPPGTERSFFINATSAPNKSGLRAYIHDYGSVRGRECVFFGSYKGTGGRSCMLRVSNQFGEIFSQEFNLNNVWEEKGFAVNVPDVDGKYLAIDFVHNPSRTNAALMSFRAGKFGMALGQVAPRYESRSSELERGLAAGIFKEGSIFVNGTAFGSIDLGLAPGTAIDLQAISSAGSVNVQNLDSLGAAVNIPAATGLNKIQYRAASVIRTPETN